MMIYKPLTRAQMISAVMNYKVTEGAKDILVDNYIKLWNPDVTEKMIKSTLWKCISEGFIDETSYEITEDGAKYLFEVLNG